MYQVQDAAEQAGDRIYAMSYSADELERIEERLDIIHRLRRKYGATCEDILAYLDRAKAELDEIEFADEKMEQLRKKEKAALREAMDAAMALRESRKQAAAGLAERVLKELADLDMK